jgi:hypothetical protein
MAEPVGTGGPELRPPAACDEGGEAPCSAHLLEDLVPVSDGMPVDVDDLPAGPG